MGSLRIEAMSTPAALVRLDVEGGGRAVPDSTLKEAKMARFLVLPRDPVGAWEDLGPADMQRIVEKYTAWTTRLAEAGRLVGGEKLEDGDGRVVTGEGDGLRVSNGPFAEAKEVVGGFWILQAEDYEEAVRLVSDCPHVGVGTLEIRRIEEMDG